MSYELNYFETFILNHLDKNLDWVKLSANPKITTNFVDLYPEFLWHYGSDGLSCNPNVTPEYVNAHLDKNWRWGYRDGYAGSRDVLEAREAVSRRAGADAHRGLKRGFR